LICDPIDLTLLIEVTTKGMRLTNALNALLAASIDNLLKIAA
jgi:hypothetical protein